MPTKNKRNNGSGILRETVTTLVQDQDFYVYQNEAGEITRIDLSNFVKNTGDIVKVSDLEIYLKEDDFAIEKQKLAKADLSNVVTIPDFVREQLKGDPGQNGSNGSNGTDGKSAYQLWLDQGNSGSLADFLTSLKGQKGDAGTLADETITRISKVSPVSYVYKNEASEEKEIDLSIFVLKDDLIDEDYLRKQELDSHLLPYQTIADFDIEKQKLAKADLTNVVTLPASVRDQLKGDPGQNGQNGSDGTDGKSAYQLWLDQGNSGSLADFLTSLKGQKGDPGTLANETITSIRRASPLSFIYTNELSEEFNIDLSQFVLRGDVLYKNPDLSLYQTIADFDIEKQKLAKADLTNVVTLPASVRDQLKGDPGQNGQNGSDGTDGKSAYQLWLDQGNSGSLSDYIASLKGGKGDPGQNGSNGSNGTDGKSAYQLWLDQGNSGSLADFLTSLKGQKGDPGTLADETITRISKVSPVSYVYKNEASEEKEIDLSIFVLKDDLIDEDYLRKQELDSHLLPYQTIADFDIEKQKLAKADLTNVVTLPASVRDQLKGDPGQNGQNGSDGTDGKSAYQLWLDQGNSGSLSDYIASLKGGKGDPGQNGSNGSNGTDGKSAYQLWLDQGNSGSLADFLTSLKGQKGDPGTLADETITRISKVSPVSYVYKNEASEEKEIDLSIFVLKDDLIDEDYLRKQELDSHLLPYQTIADFDIEKQKLAKADLTNVVTLPASVRDQLKGDPGQNGQNGSDGTDGKSAYQLWLDQGNSGSLADFLTSLKGGKGDPGQNGSNGSDGTDGKSAYRLWLDQGNSGSLSDYIASLKGGKGDPGQNGSNGSDGTDGKSAYQLWLDQGNSGSLTDYMASLKGGKGDPGQNGSDGLNGTDGKSAYQLWLDQGNSGSLTDYMASLKGGKGDPGQNGSDGLNGTDGKSAYQLWLDQGNSGSLTDYMASLKGGKGDPGQNGSNGSNGTDGKSAYQLWLDQGNSGSLADYLNGLKGIDGKKGETAYELWKIAGNTGSMTDFLNSLKGSKGDPGTNGINGKDYTLQVLNITQSGGTLTLDQTFNNKLVHLDNRNGQPVTIVAGGSRLPDNFQVAIKKSNDSEVRVVEQDGRTIHKNPRKSEIFDDVFETVYIYVSGGNLYLDGALKLK